MRSSSKNKAPAASTALTSEVVRELSDNVDIIGDDSMPKIVTHTLKSGEVIKTHPDGRSCRTCFFKDSDYDPVYIVLKKERHLMRWWKPPTKLGISQSYTCAYCARWFCHMIRPSRIPAVAMNEYENELGKDVTRLQHHVSIVIQSIISSINRGSLERHLNWMAVQNNCINLIKSKRAVFRKKNSFLNIGDWIITSPSTAILIQTVCSAEYTVSTFWMGWLAF